MEGGIFLATVGLQADCVIHIILLRSFIFKIVQFEFRYLISVNSLYNLIMLLVHDVIYLLLIS
jgi:hypothetical protein